MPKSKWLDPGRHLTWKRLLGWSGLGVLAVWLILTSPAGDWIRTNVDHGLLFKTRSFVGAESQLDERLKIFSFDDASSGEIMGAGFSLEQWGQLIQGLGEQNPKLIMVDKGFHWSPDEAAKQAFTDHLSKISTPVIVSGFVSTESIEARSSLPFDREEYVLTRYFNLDGTKFPKIDWMPKSTMIPYGPSADLLPNFSGIGHAEYDGDGYVKPFYRLSPSQVMPHWGLLAAESVRIDRGDLVINNERLHPDKNGRLLVNLGRSDEYRERTKSVATLLAASAEQRLGEIVGEGDIVLILPQVYAASVLAKDTPNGSVPIPYMSVAVLNSVLTGDWVDAPMNEWWALIVPAVASILVAIWFPALSSTLFLGVSVGFFLMIAIIGFVWLGWILPWGTTCLSLLSTTWAIRLGRLWVSYWKGKHVKASLNGVMPSSQLEDIIRGSSSKSAEASEQVVTLLYIDVVGFARSADSRSPREVFSQLKHLTARITSTVHSHGGVVDKVLGDGVLCYFGQQLAEGRFMQNHADQALKCAIKLQRDNLRLCLDSRLSQSFVNPLRIGIHTGAVFIDAMTKARRVDFTVIGHGVNFAKQLQSACDSHKVMIGATTRDLLTSFQSEAEEFRQCSLKITHHQEPFEAYEYNPFVHDPDMLAKARQMSLAVVEGDRKDTRWPVVPRGVIQMTSENHFGMVIDFSRCGLAVRMQSFLPTGSELVLSLGTRDGSLQAQFEKEGLTAIRATVRWGRKTRDGYLHGFSFEEVDDQQGQKLVQIMRSALRGSVADLDPTGTR